MVPNSHSYTYWGQFRQDPINLPACPVTVYIAVYRTDDVYLQSVMMEEGLYIQEGRLVYIASCIQDR